MNKEQFMTKYNMIEINDNNIDIELKYATENNFTKQKLYKNNDCLLRINTYNKLLKANQIFKKYGLHIKIWDAFRTLETQYIMWNICPDERFVASPFKNNNNHCKGSAVDITLCDNDNREVLMPTKFDHFGIESSIEYFNKLNDKQKENVILLHNVMKECGFESFESEWWHFNDSDNYEIIKEIYK